MIVLITGAASGIGAATARRLHERGDSVVLIDRDESGLTALGQHFEAAHSLCYTADVTDSAAVAGAVEAGIDRFGGIDTVIANAGTGCWSPVAEMTSEDFRRIVDINLVGLFHTVRATVRPLIERRGYLLAVASVASFVTAPGLAAYGASKAGVEQLINAVRLEMAPLGVGVGCAHFSWVDTPLLRRIRTVSPGFAAMFDVLPGPLTRVVSAELCADRIVGAVDRRSRHLFVPGWVGLARWAKPVLSTVPVERHLAARVPGAIR